MSPSTREHGSVAPDISLIFPTYNAAALVERTCREVSCFLRTAPGTWEVLFICDGCTDGTPELLRTLAQDAGDRIRVLAHHPNRGKGYAVRQGLAGARGRWHIFTDVDLAYGWEDVLRVTEALRSGVEVAIASRNHPDSTLTLPSRLQGYVYRRHWQSLAFHRLVRLLLPLQQTDTQAGLKGLSARATRLVLPRLQVDGFGFDCELLTACVRHGLPITEVPVSVRYTDTVSTTGLGTIGRMVWELWKIRRSWRPDALGGPDGVDAPEYGKAA